MRTHVETPLLIPTLAGQPDGFPIFRADGGDTALVAICGDEFFRPAHTEISGDLGGVDVELIAARGVIEHPRIRSGKGDTRLPITTRILCDLDFLRPTALCRVEDPCEDIRQRATHSLPHDLYSAGGICRGFGKGVATMWGAGEHKKFSERAVAHNVCAQFHEVPVIHL